MSLLISFLAGDFINLVKPAIIELSNGFLNPLTHRVTELFCSCTSIVYRRRRCHDRQTPPTPTRSSSCAHVAHKFTCKSQQSVASGVNTKSRISSFPFNPPELVADLTWLDLPRLLTCISSTSRLLPAICLSATKKLGNKLTWEPHHKSIRRADAK